MFDTIIVGAGATSAAAAFQLRDKKVLILDVGNRPENHPDLSENLFDLRRKDAGQQDYLIGSRFESLSALMSQDLVSVKLKAPYSSFVVKNAFDFFKIKSNNFNPFISYAYGGLANAWGGGVYRYTDVELDGFPLNESDLAPYYDRLTKYIGINGEADDLLPFLGPSDHLQKPIRLNRNSRHLLQAYRNKKKRLNERGIWIGRTRLAVLTEELNGRQPCDFKNLSFFSCNIPYLYNPAMTLDQLKTRTNISYKKGYFVETFSETNGRVQVRAKDLKSGKVVDFTARKLLLAAGTIGTGRIVLASYGDTGTRLPLMDNPVTFTPFVDLRSLGAGLDKRGYEGGLLNLVYEGPLHPDRVIAAIYSYISPLRSDIFFNFPFSFRGNMSLVKYAVPSLTIVQMFYPEKPRAENFIQLQADGSLLINYTGQDERGDIEHFLIRQFRKMGFISAPSLVQYPAPGNCIHYAGTVPMGGTENRYFVDGNGVLSNTKNVHIIDGSILPTLPAKNLTLTLMANAMRIADTVMKDL